MNALREIDQTWSSRGSKSRNKVSVGEPAEGSLFDLEEEAFAKMPPFLLCELNLYFCIFFHFDAFFGKLKIKTTFSNGSLGSCIDEERSEMRYVM